MQLTDFKTRDTGGVTARNLRRRWWTRLRGRIATRAVVAAAGLLALGATGGCADGDRAVAAAPLQQTYTSPDALSRAVLDALADGDIATLRTFPLDELEFRAAVWPELPSSRPDHGVPFDYAWGDLYQKSDNALRRLVARHGGHRYELVEVRFAEETTAYDSYRVHRESVLTLRDEAGEEIEVSFFGSILERQGAFKLFSYVVD